MDDVYSKKCVIFAIIFSLVMFSPSCGPTLKKKEMPKDELNSLMNAVLPFARQMLAEHGEFLPYGGVITTQGEIVSIGASDGVEHSTSQKLIDIMTESFQVKAKAGEYRATAIVFDVRIIDPATGHKSDAIQMNLDHMENMSISVLLPYKIESKGSVTYGEMFTQQGDSQIFSQR